MASALVQWTGLFQNREWGIKEWDRNLKFVRADR